jgi:hypothetical protein
LEPVDTRTNILRGAGLAALNTKKDMCAKGHRFTPQNTYITKHGSRFCRECGRAACRELYKKKKGSRFSSRNFEISVISFGDIGFGNMYKSKLANQSSETLTHSNIQMSLHSFSYLASRTIFSTSNFESRFGYLLR